MSSHKGGLPTQRERRLAAIYERLDAENREESTKLASLWKVHQVDAVELATWDREARRDASPEGP
jgi:hypothetical protein